MNNLNQQVEELLFKNQDLMYKEFHKSLGTNLNPNVELIGIRMNIIKEITKNLIKTYNIDYLLNNIEENYHEQVLMKGLIIASNKNLPFEQLNEYIKYYVNKITDWSLCDSFCSNLKISKKYLKELWPLINEYLNSKKEYEVRFGLVMILNYYLSDEYIDTVFNIINNVKLDKYYVKMANAWLISYCFIKYFDKTFEFYSSKIFIDKWTYNKGIQKAIESYRISDFHKEMLKNLRIK